jgi:hypothetical protein
MKILLKKCTVSSPSHFFRQHACLRIGETVAAIRIESHTRRRLASSRVSLPTLLPSVRYGYMNPGDKLVCIEEACISSSLEVRSPGRFIIKMTELWVIMG